MDMTAILETKRVRLREFRQDDLDDLATMVADHDQMRFSPRPRTRQEATAWIQRNLVLYEEHGFGFWRMESVASSAFLGYCGIRPQTVARLPEIEMGWHTKKTSWSQGIATEAALACRDLAFIRFGLQRLVAVIDPAHAASRRVAERIGMQLEKTAVHEDYPCLVYTIAAGREPVRVDSLRGS